MSSRISILFALSLSILLTACAPATPPPAPILPSPSPQPTPLPPAPILTPEPISVGAPVIEYDNNGLGKLLVISSVTGKTFEAFAPIQLGQNYSYAFAPDGRTLALVSNGDLYLIDLPSWKYRTFPDAGPHGWLSAVVYNTDGTLLALASGDPDAALRIVDAKSGEVKASAQTGFAIRKVKFTAGGKALMVYGPRIAAGGPAANAGVSVGAPKVALFNVSDLRVLWSVELNGVRHGVFPKNPETANTQAIYEPGAATQYEPGAAFAPERDALYLIHGDEDKLTTVDFINQKVRTVDVRVKTTWLDQLLALTAGVAYAKGMDGTIKQAVISPDGKFLYVTGNTSTVSQRADGNWDITFTPIGLQMIAAEDGALLATVDNGASSIIALSPNGDQILLSSWNTNSSDVYDLAAARLIKRMDNVYLTPTRRMDGSSILVASHSVSSYQCDTTTLDPATLIILGEWKGSTCPGWLTEP